MKKITFGSSIFALLLSLIIAAPAFAEDATSNPTTGIHDGRPLEMRMHAEGSGMATGTLDARLEMQAQHSATMGTHASSTGMHPFMQGGDWMARGQTIGKDAIEKRIQALQELSARIGQMTRLSASQIAEIQTRLQASITSLTALEATIGTDTATTTLKADIESITKNNRVFLLVLPQAQITAAADRILSVAGQLENLSVKLSARIDAAQTAGTDVTTESAALSDMNTKIADAKVQATAAVTVVANLAPDNGSATVKAANTTALQSARTKLEAARKDIGDAYKDAQTIISGVRGTGSADVKASVHADATANVNANTK